MTVYFANAGLIDMDVIRVMGVSVKTKDNPIGYFGTGLKFAIATLLRTGHTVTLRRGSDVHEFSAREAAIRGSFIKRVFMDEEALPFTVELGKNWEVWQAYRELHSNTLDEGGVISDKPQRADTVFAVDGPAIHREFLNRDAIFVSTKPLDANAFLEVHPGETSTVFYRGVRAGRMPKGLRYTYNILQGCTLTEDRTFESQFDVEWKLCTMIPKFTHKGVLTDLLCGGDAFDQQLDFSRSGSPSREFLEVAAQHYTNTSANASARWMVERDMQERGSFPPARLSDADQAKFLAAFEHLRNMGCTLSPEDVEIVESLGPSTMGLYHKAKHQIYLAKSTLDWGLETVVATLFEGWLHRDYGYADKSRELQNYLFQRLVALGMGRPHDPPQKQNPDLGIPFW